MRIRPVSSRKLLVASIGVAAVSYVACAEQKPPSSGNLMPPQPTMDAGPPQQPPPTSGNLMPAPSTDPTAAPTH